VGTNRSRLPPPGHKISNDSGILVFAAFFSLISARPEFYLRDLAAGGPFLRTRQDDAAGRFHFAGDYASRSRRNIAKVIDLGPGSGLGHL